MTSITQQSADLARQGYSTRAIAARVGRRPKDVAALLTNRRRSGEPREPLETRVLRFLERNGELTVPQLVTRTGSTRGRVGRVCQGLIEQRLAVVTGIRESDGMALIAAADGGVA